MAAAAKGSRFIAFVLAVLAAASLGEYFNGGVEAREYLLFAIGFGLAAVAEMYRPPGLFSSCWRQVPASRGLVLYCGCNLAAVALVLLGAYSEWP